MDPARFLPVEIPHAELWLLGAITVLVAVTLWLSIRLGRLQAEQAALPEALGELIDGRLAEQHRAVLADLHAGLERQGDRLSAHATDHADRLKSGVDADLTATRESMQALNLSLHRSLAEQREILVLKLAELGGGVSSRQEQLRGELTEKLTAAQAQGAERLRGMVSQELGATRRQLEALQLSVQGRLDAQREDSALKLAQLATTLTDGLARMRGEVLETTLERITEHGRKDRELLAASIEALTRTINERMEAISGKVNERLDEGFRKTNETFANVMARLATIDEAQKKIDGLTTNVVSLQELLGDKKSRGAFGEVQLEALVINALPPDAYEFQAGLPNGTRVDCLLKLPEPTGQVAVDSKFPLENYQRMYEPGAGDPERKLAQTAFRSDVRKHIDAIASKYIIADVTSDGAVMFVPAEAVFAEIHAYQPEIVAYAQSKRVWVVSPTTLMAVLNTARAVLKDVETRKQIHVIKDALGKLSKDFARFDERMQKLATHIEQASKDVRDVQVSSRKISGHFHKIESARLDELDEGDDDAPPLLNG